MAKTFSAAATPSSSTFSQSVPFADVHVFEYSSLSIAAPREVTACGASGSGATAGVGPADTTSASELIFAAAMTGGVINSQAPASPLASRPVDADGDIGEDMMVTATGSYTAPAPVTTYNRTSTWVMQMATFK